MALFKLFGKKKPKRTAPKKPKKHVSKKSKKIHVKKKIFKKKPMKKVVIKKIKKPKITPTKIMKTKTPKVNMPKVIEPVLNKMPDEKAYEILRRFRIPLPEYAFCKNEKDLRLSLKKIGFPCVMKVSGRIVHKTNVNGVRLDIKNEDEAVKTFFELMKINGCERVLVQKMITEGYEIIVGGKQDPQFNRIVALGAGGIFTEFLKDVSFRICPLERADAEDMLREVRFSDLILKGFRGQKPANKDSIVDIVLAVSRIMENNPKIKELDINPIFATSTKAIAADVRIILE